MEHTTNRIRHTTSRLRFTRAHTKWIAIVLGASVLAVNAAGATATPGTGVAGTGVAGTGVAGPGVAGTGMAGTGVGRASVASDDVGQASIAVIQEPTLLGSRNPSSPETFRIRPEVLSLSGDGTVFVGGPGWKVRGKRVLSFGSIGWTSFGGAQASGQGLVWLNDCKPNCADGSFQHHPARIQAKAIQKHHYTALIVSFTAGGRSATDKYTLRTAGSSSYWQLADTGSRTG